MDAGNKGLGEIKMVKTIVEIEGMACGMCEAHINEVIRNNFKIKKVKASRKKKEAVVQSEEELDTEKLKKVINESGYTFDSAHEEQ